MSHRALGWLAAITLFIAAAVELSMVVRKLGWPRFANDIAHSNIISGALAILFTATAIVILLRRHSARLATAAFLLGIGSTLAMLFHSLVGLAVGYLPVAVWMAVLLALMWRGSEWRQARRMARNADMSHPPHIPRNA